MAAELYRLLPGPHCPILVVSAVGPRLAEAAQKIGAVDWLPKPFDLQHLLDLVALHARDA